MATLSSLTLTEDEYLALEREAETKSEYHDGQMFAMAGGSPNHSLLCSRIGGMLDRAVKLPCRLFNSDLRIYIPALNIYTYADCSVICGAVQYSNNRRDGVLNPKLIVEVLSPTTEAYDRSKKFDFYRTLPTFREYLLVHQDCHRVEYFSWQSDNNWLLSDYSNDNSSVNIESLNASISIAELYAPLLDEASES